MPRVNGAYGSNMGNWPPCESIEYCGEAFKQCDKTPRYSVVDCTYEQVPPAVISCADHVVSLANERGFVKFYVTDLKKVEEMY